MIRFKTESGSVYEADPDARRWRRAGQDWQEYEHAILPALGKPALFLRQDGDEIHRLSTTRVVEIERVEKRMIEIEIVTGEDN